jgi:uncharacterized protein (UPF0335 family)
MQESYKLAVAELNRVVQLMLDEIEKLNKEKKRLQEDVDDLNCVLDRR